MNVSLNFIYTALIHNNNHLQLMFYCRTEIMQYYRKKTNNVKPNDLNILYEQTLGYNGKDKLPFNKQKPPVEPGSGRSRHLLLLVWVEGRKMGQGHTVESLINLLLYTVKKMDVATMTSLIACLYISPAGRSLDLQCVMG